MNEQPIVVMPTEEFINAIVKGLCPRCGGELTQCGAYCHWYCRSNACTNGGAYDVYEIILAPSVQKYVLMLVTRNAVSDAINDVAARIVRELVSINAFRKSANIAMVHNTVAQVLGVPER
jgi:hypothetical protein